MQPKHLEVVIRELDWTIFHFKYSWYMLTIAVEDFELRITPISARCEEPGGPYLEWMEINLVAPGIRAEGRWSVMPVELLEFQHQLQSMHDQLQPGQSAQLSGAEPGFKMKLRMLERGWILGDWRFQPSPPDGVLITGNFGIDQSYLDEILRSIDRLRSSRQ